MMFKCNNCNSIFDESEIATERESRGEYWGAPAYETVSVCPRCKGDDFMELDKKCDCCGELITDDYYDVEGEIYCLHCLTENEHSPKRTRAIIKCDTCGKEIENAYHAVNGCNYCPDCYTASEDEYVSASVITCDCCEDEIEGSHYVTDNDIFFCRNCVTKKYIS